jgi:hypothetical protein
MASIVLRDYPRMDVVTNDLAEIRRVLAKKSGHPDYALSKPLEQQSTATGCAVLNWNRQTVSMICFNSGTQPNLGEPSDLFLFVVDTAAVPKAPPARPRFAQLNKLATLSWSAAGKTYVLAGYGDEAFIRKFL